MKESYLSYIWKFRLYENEHLQTTRGESLQVLQPGTLNEDAGPDFFNAKIKIGSTLWSGNVEIHQKSSDWKSHQHTGNKAYESVVLHLVYEHDTEIYRMDGTLIPVLELKNHISTKIKHNFLYHFHNQSWIVCDKRIQEVDPFLIEHFMDRLLVERLEQKVEPISQSLEANQNDWEESYYQFLMQSFGLRVNKQPFELIARQLPLSVLLKHRSELIQLEALLFGMAGLLEESLEDTYYNQLQAEFKHLQRKFQLQAINTKTCKFARLRPASFPTIRLAQMAQLLHQKDRLFSTMLQLKTIEEVEAFFTVQTSKYWETHYVFGKASKSQKKQLGKGTIRLILINTIIPFLFLYGKRMQNEKLENRAFQFLESLPKEKNKIIDQWTQLKVPCKNAFQSQALLQLKNTYCNQKRCLDCNIGHQILKG